MSSKYKVVVITLSALAIYVGSYAFVVTPARLPFMTGLPPWPRVPSYAGAATIAEPVFAPLVVVDKKLFPRRWLFTREDLDAFVKGKAQPGAPGQRP